MAESELLISELFTIDALATRSIKLREVSALSHEVWDHSVEDAVLIV